MTDIVYMKEQKLKRKRKKNDAAKDKSFSAQRT